MPIFARQATDMELLEQVLPACRTNRNSLRTAEAHTRRVLRFLRFHRQQAGRCAYLQDMVADADGKLGAVFSPETHAAQMRIEASGLASGASIVGVVTRDGVEQPALGWSEIWTGSAAGSIDRSISGASGLTIFHLARGEYEVELYVDGALAARGMFRVE